MIENIQFNQDEVHLYFAREISAETWQLLDKGNRTIEDDERLLAAAFASYYHLLYTGKEVHRQRAEYMLARVYLALGNPQEALSHARRCLELTDQYQDQMEDFDFAFAYEIFARANTIFGQADIAREYWELARIAGNHIKDDEDRKIFYADLNASNWFYLYSHERSDPQILVMIPLDADYSFTTRGDPSDFLKEKSYD
jgi:tetratricopeptide (TPR) repeat protein